MPHSRRQLFANAAIAASRVAAQPRFAERPMMPKGERPEPRHPHRRGVDLEDAADNNAIGKDVGKSSSFHSPDEREAGSRDGLEDQRRFGHRPSWRQSVPVAGGGVD
jgi:hypothetical protein